MEMEAAATEAMAMEKRGDRRGARKYMARVLAACAPSLAAPDRAEYEGLADRLSTGLTEDERKTRDFQSYQRRHSRE